MLGSLSVCLECLLSATDIVCLEATQNRSSRQVLATGSVWRLPVAIPISPPSVDCIKSCLFAHKGTQFEHLHFWGGPWTKLAKIVTTRVRIVLFLVIRTLSTSWAWRIFTLDFFKILRFLDFQTYQIPKFANAGAGGVGRTLRSQLDPSPHTPRD